MAAQCGHEQIVQILLEKGANVDIATEVLVVDCFFFFSLSLIFLFF